MPKRDFARVRPDDAQLIRASREMYPPFNTRMWRIWETIVNHSLIRTIDILFEREQEENPLTDDYDGHVEPRECRCFASEGTPGQFKFRGM